VTTLALNRLNRRNAVALVRRVIVNQTLPGEIVDDIVERTDGVPLFVEELTKSVLETSLGMEDQAIASPPSARLSVPATLHAPLMARLDALGTAKEIAQAGSAIGREFSFEMLSAVAERPSDQLQVELNKLVGSGLIFQRGTPPHATAHCCGQCVDPFTRKSLNGLLNVPPSSVLSSHPS
jgi:predicted ATPase